MKPELELLEDRITPTAVCEANPTYQAECAYLGNLIPQSAVTLTAMHSGNWSNAATWGGRTPTANDVVYIPHGDTVTVDNTSANALAVLNNGVLTFDPSTNTKLTVDTVVSGTDTHSPGNPQGELDIGTAAHPIQAGYTATLEFQRAPAAVRNALFENGNDYDSLSGGLISMGTLNIYGSQVRPYVANTGPLIPGTTTVALASAPVGWKVGDTLLFPGTAPTSFNKYGQPVAPPDQDEQIQIAAINGNVVTLATPLQYAHTPAPDTQFLIADETRNVVIESAPGTPTDQQGHVMQMHNDAAGIAYAAFLNLGRTDKSQPLANGSPTNGPGLNQVGRYALHFHRDSYPGLTDKDPPIRVVGCFEEGSPGWGYDNHSSNVDFEQDVAYDNFGAGFATEAGNEIGTFNQCYAIRSIGVAGVHVGPGNFNNFTSMGIDGEGFWLQSPAVAVTNCITTDCTVGYAEWSLGLVEKNLGAAQLYVPWLPNANLYPSYLKNYVGVNGVPFSDFFGDTVSFATDGMDIAWNCQISPSRSFSTVNDFTASYVTNGVHGLKYAERVSVQNATFLACPGEPISGPPLSDIGVNSGAGYTVGWRFLNLNVQGFTFGAVPSNEGTDIIQGGYYNNATNFYIFLGFPDTIYNFSGVTFGPASGMDYRLPNPFPANLGWTAYIVPAEVFVDGQELYWPYQSPTALPFPTANPSVPPQLIGLTSQQIYQMYGLLPGGELAPAGAVSKSWTNGLLGPVETMPGYYALSRMLAPADKPYTLRYSLLVNGVLSYFTYPTPFTLQHGWNAITLLLNGHKTTFFVFGT
jgi:hypothetical protein